MGLWNKRIKERLSDQIMRNFRVMPVYGDSVKNAEAYAEPLQTSKMECFERIAERLFLQVI